MGRCPTDGIPWQNVLLDQTPHPSAKCAVPFIADGLNVPRPIPGEPKSGQSENPQPYDFAGLMDMSTLEVQRQSIISPTLFQPLDELCQMAYDHQVNVAHCFDKANVIECLRCAISPVVGECPTLSAWLCIVLPAVVRYVRATDSGFSVLR